MEKNTDVYCVYRNSKTGKEEVCILKSKAIEHLMDNGLSFEEAQEYYDFNIAGAMGHGQYSCVDDTLDEDFITELIKDGSYYDPPTHDLQGDS